MRQPLSRYKRENSKIIKSRSRMYVAYDILYISIHRFELSHKKDYLKQQTNHAVNHLGFDELTALLCDTLEQADPLMQNYLIDPLWSGEMLSKELQKKRIKNAYHSKKEHRKKMLA